MLGILPFHSPLIQCRHQLFTVFCLQGLKHVPPFRCFRGGSRDILRLPPIIPLNLLVCKTAAQQTRRCAAFTLFSGQLLFVHPRFSLLATTEKMRSVYCSVKWPPISFLTPECFPIGRFIALYIGPPFPFQLLNASPFAGRSGG